MDAPLFLSGMSLTSGVCASLYRLYSTLWMLATARFFRYVLLLPNSLTSLLDLFPIFLLPCELGPSSGDHWVSRIYLSPLRYCQNYSDKGTQKKPTPESNYGTTGYIMQCCQSLRKKRSLSGVLPMETWVLFFFSLLPAPAMSPSQASPRPQMAAEPQFGPA